MGKLNPLIFDGPKQPSLKIPLIMSGERSYLLPVLRRIIKKYYPGCAIENFKISDPIKDWVMRRIHRYTVVLSEKNKRNITKIFYGISARDKKNKKAFYVLRHLWKHDLSNYIPRPLFYSNKHHLFIFEEFPGKIFLDYFKENKSLKFIEEKLLASAKILALLHQAPANHSLASVLPRDWKEEYDYVFKKKIQVAKERYPQHFTFIEKIIANEKKLTEQFLDPLHFVLVHHDFTPDNIVINSKRAGIIDFSEAQLNDPIDDIASLFIRFRMMQAGYPEGYEGIYFSRKALHRFQKRFFNEYLKHNKNLSLKNLEDRIKIFFVQFATHMPLVHSTKNSFWMFQLADRVLRDKEQII